MNVTAAIRELRNWRTPAGRVWRAVCNVRRYGTTGEEIDADSGVLEVRRIDAAIVSIKTGTVSFGIARSDLTAFIVGLVGVIDPAVGANYRAREIATAGYCAAFTSVEGHVIGSLLVDTLNDVYSMSANNSRT